MSTTDSDRRALPDSPNLDQLRTQARELQHAIRAGDAKVLALAGREHADTTFPLHAAQLLLARQYGFASWPRLSAQVKAINARTWVLGSPPPDEGIGDRFLRLACLDYSSDSPTRRDAAAELLAEHPELPATDLAVAAVCGREDLVAGLIQRNPAAATTGTGPHGWAPLFYLAYGRIDTDREATLATARVLLEAGADPNDGRFFDGLVTPFTVLTGVLGGGELDQPPHRHSIPLARLLLEAGADPNDAQALYNRQFGTADDFLDLLLEFGLGQDQDGPWTRLLPDALEPPSALLRGLLEWAVVHDQRDRVDTLIRAGVDLAAPLADGRTPIEAALLSGHVALAERLRAGGAGEPRFSPVESVVAAVLAADADAIRQLGTAALAAARSARPGLVVWAASQGGAAAVQLACGLGFDVNALARADIPREQPWQTALHTAVERNAVELIRLLLDLGADPTIRDQRFDATAAQWAEHFNHQECLELL
jgi:ankyrin repeat protein